MSDGDLVLLGVIGKPHGLSGEVTVRLFSDEPEAHLDRRAFLVGVAGSEPVPRDVRQARACANGLLVRFEGVDDRDAAEALRGRHLFVTRASLPEPEEGSYYYADLEGLAVDLRDGDGGLVSDWGTVVRVFSHGAGDILEVTRAGHDPVFVPFTDEAVPEVRLGEKRLVVSGSYARQEAWCDSGS